MRLVKLQRSDVTNYLFWLVIITLPLPMIVNNIAIILFAIHSAIYFQPSKLKLEAPLLFLPIIFLVSLFSLLYTTDVSKGLKALEKVIPFIVFYLFLSPISFSKTEVLKYLRAFAYINVALILICLTVATFLTIKNQTFIIYNPLNFVNENYFLYHRFSKPIGFHAIYLGIYTIFSSSILLIDLSNQPKKIKHYTMLAILFVGVILLKSFAVALSYFLILLFYFLYFKPITLNKFKGFFLVSLLIIAISLFYYKAKGINKEVFSYNLQDDVHNPNWNSLNIRLAKWECAIEASKTNKILGVGVGSGQMELNKTYSDKDFILGISNNFSTHNQYLHYLVEFGVIGLLLFIIGIIMNIYSSLIKRNFLLFSLILLLSVCSITENVLTLNKGIVFFSVFFFLVYKLNETEKAL